MFPIDFLIKAARAWPDSVAIETPGRTLSFRELLAQANALACGVQKLCAKRHPRVAILSPNSLDLFVTIMAIHAGGFQLVPLNPRNSRVELDDQLAAAAPDALIADPAVRHGLGSFAGIEIATAGADGYPTIATLIAQHRGKSPIWSIVDADEVNAYKFTGGSSGKPKAVLQTFRNFNTVVASIVMAFGFDETERNLIVAPMTHGAGMFMMPVVARGGRCVIPDATGPADILDAFERHAITTVWMPPTLLYMLLEKPDVAQRAYHLRHLIWGGAAAAPEKLKRARDIFGNVVEAVYGQTEASTIATAITAPEITDDRLFESVGRPTPLTQVAIMGSDGQTLAPGKAGEIVIRGDLVMKGYHGMPDATAEAIRDGWLHTGDVGYLDDRGYLFIKDRIKDVIISGGFNVYPSDVEAALARHPAVHESVVFGLPDDKWGERVEAAVQLKSDLVVTDADLVTFAKTQVGSIKAPKHVHILDQLPRSPVGKILRREVKALFAAKGA